MNQARRIHDRYIPSSLTTGFIGFGASAQRTRR